MQPGKRLILKCPIHCLYPDVLKKVFPSAKFIFPYRNAKTMVSSCSAIVNQQCKAFLGTDDSLGAGKRLTEFYKHGSQRIVQFLKQLPESDYITLPYSKLVGDTLGTVRLIYAHFNLNLTSKTEELLQKHLKENYQHKHGKARYTAEEFGITDEIIKENMKEYLEYFANGPEKLL